jgi:hypothetical protein
VRTVRIEEPARADAIRELIERSEALKRSEALNGMPPRGDCRSRCHDWAVGVAAADTIGQGVEAGAIATH